MATILRNATAVWTGTGKDGRGTLTTESGTLREAPYSFAKRFGEEKGTNPKEAHDLSVIHTTEVCRRWRALKATGAVINAL